MPDLTEELFRVPDAGIHPGEGEPHDPAAYLVSTTEAMAEFKEKMGTTTFNLERWLLNHGESFGPNIALPKGVGLMTQKECYSNTLKSLIHRDVDPAEWFYCEGLAVRFDLPVAFEHAWLGNRKGEVIDRTWRESGSGKRGRTRPVKAGEAAYYGIPYKLDFAKEQTFRRGYYGLHSNGIHYNKELIEMDPAVYRAWAKGER
jgi:hypothetical protein